MLIRGSTLNENVALEFLDRSIGSVIVDKINTMPTPTGNALSLSKQEAGKGVIVIYRGLVSVQLLKSSSSSRSFKASSIVLMSLRRRSAFVAHRDVDVDATVRAESGSGTPSNRRESTGWMEGERRPQGAPGCTWRKGKSCTGWDPKEEAIVARPWR